MSIVKEITDTPEKLEKHPFGSGLLVGIVCGFTISVAIFAVLIPTKILDSFAFFKSVKENLIEPNITELTMFSQKQSDDIQLMSRDKFEAIRELEDLQKSYDIEYQKRFEAERWKDKHYITNASFAVIILRSKGLLQSKFAEKLKNDLREEVIPALENAVLRGVKGAESVLNEVRKVLK